MLDVDVELSVVEEDTEFVTLADCVSVSRPLKDDIADEDEVVDHDDIFTELIVVD